MNGIQQIYQMFVTTANRLFLMLSQLSIYGFTLLSIVTFGVVLTIIITNISGGKK